ncbi:MAG: hypothetical protein A3J75_08670 [Acidobacteria bacterium RBG_16_68_9]|nr:MAG: hypothetical protein A3J75_08670 [Acidobacteria bacterium RBG_16_68_9]
MERVRCLTLADLVQAVQDTASTDEEVVAVIDHMLRTRRLLRPQAPDLLLAAASPQGPVAASA